MSKHIGVKLEENTWKKFKMILAREGKTVQEILEKLVKLYIRNNEQ